MVYLAEPDKAAAGLFPLYPSVLPPLTLTAHNVEMALDILGSVLAEMDPSKTEEQA